MKTITLWVGDGFAPWPGRLLELNDGEYGVVENVEPLVDGDWVMGHITTRPARYQITLRTPTREELEAHWKEERELFATKPGLLERIADGLRS